MLQLVTNHKEIAAANKKFFAHLNSNSDSITDIHLGYHGGGDFVKAYHSSILNLWWTHVEREDYFWNAFARGGRPLEGHNYYSTVNLSYTKNGTGSRACYFGKDVEGNLSLLHSGRIGGGKPGIGKDLFWREFNGHSEFVTYRNDVYEYAVVCNIDSESLVEEIGYFVDEVDRIKKIGNGELPPRHTLPSHSFGSEFWGKKKYTLPGREIEVQSDHGYIVEELKNQLKNLGFDVANSKPIDLFCINKGKITHIFEVKTALVKQALYSGIGQLFFHSLSAPNSCVKVFVIPKGLHQDITKDLERLNLKVITFKKRKTGVAFQDLSILKRQS